MEWKPDANGWTAFIKFELRHKETERVRQLYQRFTEAHPVPKTWLKWAKFEEVRALSATETDTHTYPAPHRTTRSWLSPLRSASR